MTTVKVLETNVLHSSDVIYWLDGSTAEAQASMLRINVPLDLQFTTRPGDLKMVNGVGKTALLRRPTTEIINGIATPAQREKPAEVAYPVAGVVSDPGGRFIPRSFSISAGNANGHALVLYPSPLGVRFSPAGGLIGSVRFDGGNNATWALLTLTVTTALGGTLIFRGQANGSGDFLLPLNRLPPLPEGIEHYVATLEISALVAASATTPVDPADLTVVEVGSLGAQDDPPANLIFSNPIGLNVVPGEIRVIRSASRDHLAVQPS